jgi:hypothetical protein
VSDTPTRDSIKELMVSLEAITDPPGDAQMANLCASAIRRLSRELEQSERALSAAQEREKELRKDAASKQAKIDALMLEYCPDEMTPEQLGEWEKHQHATAIDAALTAKGEAK